MTQSILVENVSFSYGDTPVFNHLSVEFHLGECILLNGVSGCGKSTFLKLIMGKLQPTCGSIRVLGKALSEYKMYEIHKEIGYVSQNPDLQLCASTVEEELSFGLKNLGLSAEEIERRINELLPVLDLETRRTQPVSSLSGGQKQKLVIGAIVAMRPKILLLDEPLSQLDPEACEELSEFLETIYKRFKLTMVIIEHRTERFQFFATQCFSMKDGALHTFRPYPEVYQALTQPEKTGKLLCTVNDVSFHINHADILKKIDVTLYKNERVALVGHNGSGKSTLIQLIAGIISCSEGSIRCTTSLGVVFQNPDLMLTERQVKKEICTKTYLNAVDLEHVKEQHPLTLSKGQRLRCAFASILEQNPELLLMDEPTTGQDIAHINQLISLLEDKTVLFATHDYHLVKAIATRVIFLEKGHIVFNGRVDEFFNEVVETPNI